MAITSNAQLAILKQDAISELVQRELAFQSKLLATVTDVSVFAKAGEKSVSFPKSTSFAVENRAAGSEGTTQSLVYSLDRLDLDYRAHIQWLIENMDEYQANVDVKMDYMKKATSAHARNIDSIILAKLGAASGYSEIGTVTQSKILNCIQFLDQNHATDENRFMVIPPAARNAMLQIPEFVRADAFGTSNVAKGTIGSVFGLQVISHSGATKTEIYTQEALVWAFQKGAQYDEQKKIELGVGSYLAVMDQLYGSKVVRLGEGKALDNTTALAATASPFVASIG